MREPAGPPPSAPSASGPARPGPARPGPARAAGCGHAETHARARVRVWGGGVCVRRLLRVLRVCRLFKYMRSLNIIVVSIRVRGQMVKWSNGQMVK